TGPDAWRWFDIGYWLRADETGRGFAREAVRRLVRHAFDDLQTDRIEIRIEAGNHPSIAVAESAGVAREGGLRRAMFRDGGARDLCVSSMTRCPQRALRNIDSSTASAARTSTAPATIRGASRRTEAAIANARRIARADSNLRAGSKARQPATTARNANGT